MKYTYLIPILLFCMFTACKPDEIKTPAATDEPGPEITLGGFPMQIGHTWVYDNGDTIKAVSDTTINGISTRKVVKTNGTFSAEAYYANLSDGWHLVASNSANFFNVFTDPVADAGTVSATLIIPDAPVRMSKLPLVIANEWEVNVPGVSSYSRRWQGYFTVTTTAGKFDCVKLYTGTCFEYYSTKGIVKTEHIVTCITSPCPIPTAKLVSVNF